MKTKMMETLGEQGLTLPAQIEAGLAANDRLKYYFSLLQLARGQADHPDQACPSLKQERLVAGVEDSALDRMIEGARKEGASYHLSGSGQLLTMLATDARVMAVPADSAAKQRLELLLRQFPKPKGDTVDGGTIDQITHADRKMGDSLHRWVMDLHKQLNALQVGLAEESIEGAATYGLGKGDDALVCAFMTGLNRTAPLKFDHPGLGTTATRSGRKLIIQNDIGTTDAHVIVIHIEAKTVNLTYSDVHLERLQFFCALFAGFAATWSAPSGSHGAAVAEGEPFFLTTGTFDARDHKQLLAYLDYLGSRLVFLIDWNRARKQLRGFLKRRQRLLLLRWAADNDIGHRGFLELGGAQLIWTTVDTTNPAAIRLGDRLCDVLGEDKAFAFIQFTFKTATEGRLARQSDGLIRDRIRAELLDHLITAGTRYLGTVAAHAGLVFEIATAIRDHLFEPHGDSAGLRNLAKRGRHWEHDADRLVAEIALSVRQRPELAPFLQLISAADDAADELEEAAFLLGPLGSSAKHHAWESLQPLASILAEASQEWVKALANAQHVHRHGPRDDVDDFLTSIDRLASLEHDADDEERALTVATLETATDYRELHLISEIKQRLGNASDCLKRASLILRDQMVGNVLAP